MPSGTLLYLGANDGGSLASIVGDYERVFAFEAQPDNIDRLRSRFANSPHVTVVWGALSDGSASSGTTTSASASASASEEEEEGWTTFYVSSNNVSSSLGTFKDDWLKNRDGLHMTREIRVPSINLNRFCQRNGVQEIEMYVSDIQGADWMVLKTMEQPFLAKRWIKAIQTETTKDGKQNIYSSLPSNELKAFRALLAPHGYQLVATGWGLLQPGKFDSVPDEWWEFDSLWHANQPPTPPKPPSETAASTVAETKSLATDVVQPKPPPIAARAPLSMRKLASRQRGKDTAKDTHTKDVHTEAAKDGTDSKHVPDVSHNPSAENDPHVNGKKDDEVANVPSTAAKGERPKDQPTALSSKAEGDMGDWTVVTGLFDLPSETGVQGSHRSIDFYLRYRFVLELNRPLVMFCDPSTYPKVWAIRKRAGLLDRTLFVSMRMRDFPLWRFHDRIAENRKKPPVYDPKHRNTPAYMILTFGKFHMLQRAIEMNPFGTKFVAWADFGLEHIGDGKQAQVKYIDAAFAERREKPSFCYISYVPPRVSLDVKQMYAMPEGRCTIASSFFTGENQRMLTLCSRMNQEFVRIVELGHGHAEEQALATVHARHPDDFDMFYGDYYEQTINYVSIAQNAQAVLAFFIERAAQDRNWPWTADACQKLARAALDRRTVQLSDPQVVRLMECYLAAAENLPQLLPDVTALWQRAASAQPGAAAEAQRRQSPLALLLPPDSNVRLSPAALGNSEEGSGSEARSESAKAEGKVVKGADNRWALTESEVPEEEAAALAKAAWAGIDAVVFINLNTRKDRLAEIMDEYKRLRVPPEKLHRFEAIKAARSTVGCTASHLAVIKMAKSRGWKNVLVNEDDFNFIRDRRQIWIRLAQFFHRHSEQFDVLMLTAHLPSGIDKDRLANVVGILRAQNVQNAAGYIVHSRFYDKLIGCWEPSVAHLKVIDRPDLFISDQAWKHLQNSAAWFVFWPLLGYQRPSYSDLAQVFTDHHSLSNALSKLPKT